MGSEVCPKCGAEFYCANFMGTWFSCGSGFHYQTFIDSPNRCCTNRQLAAKDARIAALTEELERAKGEAAKLDAALKNYRKVRGESNGIWNPRVGIAWADVLPFLSKDIDE